MQSPYSIQQFATDLISFSFPIDNQPLLNSPLDIYVYYNPSGLTVNINDNVASLYSLDRLTPSNKLFDKQKDKILFSNFLLREFLESTTPAVSLDIRPKQKEKYEEIFNTKISTILNPQYISKQSTLLSCPPGYLPVNNNLGFRSSVQYLTFLSQLLELCQGNKHGIYLSKTLVFIASINCTTDTRLRCKIYREYKNWVNNNFIALE